MESGGAASRVVASRVFACHNRRMLSGDLQSRMAEFQSALETRDITAAEGVLHEDYALCLVSPNALVVPRAAWLSMLPDYVVHEWTVHERRVDVEGDVAAVLQRGVQRATVRGQSRDGVFVVTDIWLRTDDQWRLWRRHSTPLEAGEMPT